MYSTARALPGGAVVLRAPRCAANRRTPRRVVAIAAEGDSSSGRSAGGAGRLGRRAALAAGLLASVSGRSPGRAVAEEVQPAAAEQVEKIYFGNGCFWGRQKDFVDAEMALGRTPTSISALAGYAGGPYTAKDGRVCYYYAPPETEYERLGHAESVGLELRGGLEEQKAQLREFSRVYFKQFRRTPFGMQRQDPQDEGPGYRNVIGIPGGMDSPLMAVVEEENVNGMELLRGRGNLFDRSGAASEDDKVNRIWVMDSSKYDFHPAEVYHQFHNGLGKAFPPWYTRDMKEAALKAGIVQQTGCPENPFSVSFPSF